MKRINLFALVFLISFGMIFTGCESVQNTNNSQRGGAIGAGLGAGLGALIGKNNRALGAIVGGVVGGTAGAIIGKKMDKQAEEIDQAIPGATVERKEEGIQVILDENAQIRFGFDSSDLTAAAKTNLGKLVPIFKEYEHTDIMIVGYTDDRGADSYNQKLSERRAAAVAEYLIGQGLSPERFTTSGMGEAEPRYTNETDEGRAGNRRVEFAITANEEMVEQAEQEANAAE